MSRGLYGSPPEGLGGAPAAPSLPLLQLPGGSQCTWRSTASDRLVPTSLETWHVYCPLIVLVTSGRVTVVPCSFSRVLSLNQDTVPCGGLLPMTWHLMVTDSPSGTVVSSGLTWIFNFGASGGAEDSAEGVGNSPRVLSAEKLQPFYSGKVAAYTGRESGATPCCPCQQRWAGPSTRGLSQSPKSSLCSLQPQSPKLWSLPAASSIPRTIHQSLPLPCLKPFGGFHT